VLAFVNRRARAAIGLGAWAAVAAGVCAGASRAESQTAPRVTCEVTPGRGVELRARKPARISNLRAIPLKISFTGVKPPRVEQVRSASDVSSSTSTVIIDVAAVGNPGGAKVPIKTRLHGSGATPDEQYVLVDLGIPVDDRERDAQEMGYVEWLAALAERLPSVDSATLEMDRTRKAFLAHAFDQVFFENTVGLFDVSCACESTQPGSWNGVIRAAPIRVNVVFEGRFFDQPEFRKQ